VYPWVDRGHCVEAARVLGPKRALLEQAGRLGAVAAEHPVLDVVQGVVLAVDVVPGARTSVRAEPRDVCTAWLAERFGSDARFPKD
jgi:hypothetical protein